MRKLIILIAVFSLSLLGTAYGDDYIIGPEDMLQINVWGSPDLNVSIPVRPDGMISVPLLGDVKADGLTPSELKAYLEKEYKKYIKSPTVSVIVTAINSFKVYVIGGGVTVSGGAPGSATTGSSSGAITLKRSTTLLQLLAQLGSLQNADLNSAYMMRGGKKLQIDFMKLINNGDVTQDISLKRDDIIFIPANLADRIKVVGAVKTPGIFPYVKGMTALDAVLSAGGFTEFASQNSVIVVRQEGNGTKNIDVRLKDVIKNGEVEKNVFLKPGDMVNVKSGIF